MHQDITVVGLDLAKRVFQVHAISADGKVFAKRKLRRSEVIPFFSALRPCLIGMGALCLCTPLGSGVTCSRP
ncbi:hypothetical protein FIV00_27915 [Labrenzia sp. THAF82]|nr:hypothetical protein FIV00_27915 [Labrenzia sp. THAF82]